MTKPLLIYASLGEFCSVHSYGTIARGIEMNNVIPEIKTQGKETFMYNGTRLWNSLPDSIKLIEVKDNFKKKCKNTFSV